MTSVYDNPDWILDNIERVVGSALSCQLRDLDTVESTGVGIGAEQWLMLEAVIGERLDAEWQELIQRRSNRRRAVGNLVLMTIDWLACKIQGRA